MPQHIPPTTVAVALAFAAFQATCVSAQTMSIEQARKQVTPFYEMLNQPATKDLKALADQALSADWKSYSSESDFKGRDAFLAQVGGFGKLIPDLKWDIKDGKAITAHHVEDWAGALRQLSAK